METGAVVLSFARRFFMGTMLSRISGCARDIAMALCFGSAPEIAAFMVAFRFANLFRRLFGEGNISSGFIPHFSFLHNQNPHRAELFYRDSIATVALLSLGGVALLEGGLWALSFVVSSGWQEIIQLTMYMVPGVFFLSLYALNCAFLQFHQHYFLGGVAPVVFNLVWIGCAFFVSSFPKQEAVRLLSLGIVAAFALQWILTQVQARSHFSFSWRLWLAPSVFSSDWRHVLRPMMLGVLGIGATQINSALDAVFARFADPAGPAYLWYAIRIQQLPLALFGIALAGALLPSLSRAWADGAFERYQTLLRQAFSLCLTLFIPCTVALFVLGSAGVNLLYGHGDFQSVDVLKTTHCLWGYGIGLVPSVLTLLLASGFYAKKEYVAPTIASCLAVGFHILANSCLIFGLQWGAVSVAVSTGLAAWVNCLYLLYRFDMKLFSGLSSILTRLSIASFIGSFLSWSFSFLCGPLPRELKGQMVEAGGMAFCFLLGFLSVSYLLDIKELFVILGIKKPDPKESGFPSS